MNRDKKIVFMGTPKLYNFHGKLKNYENQMGTTKKGDCKNAYNYFRFWRKIDDDAPRQKSGTPRMLIFTVVFEEFWWYRRCKRNDALSHFEYGRDYSKIMRPQRWRTTMAQYVKWTFLGATARFWKVPNPECERHRSFTEGYRRPHREAKRSTPDELRDS